MSVAQPVCMAAVPFFFAHFYHEHKNKTGNKEADAEQEQGVVPYIIICFWNYISLCKRRLRKQDQDHEPTARCF